MRSKHFVVRIVVCTLLVVIPGIVGAQGTCDYSSEEEIVSAFQCITLRKARTDKVEGDFEGVITLQRVIDEEEFQTNQESELEKKLSDLRSLAEGLERKRTECESEDADFTRKKQRLLAEIEHQRNRIQGFNQRLAEEPRSKYAPIWREQISKAEAIIQRSMAELRSLEADLQICHLELELQLDGFKDTCEETNTLALAKATEYAPGLAHRGALPGVRQFDMWVRLMKRKVLNTLLRNGFKKIIGPERAEETIGEVAPSGEKGLLYSCELDMRFIFPIDRLYQNTGEKFEEVMVPVEVPETVSGGGGTQVGADPATEVVVRGPNGPSSCPSELRPGHCVRNETVCPSIPGPQGTREQLLCKLYTGCGCVSRTNFPVDLVFDEERELETSSQSSQNQSLLN